MNLSQLFANSKSYLNALRALFNRPPEPPNCSREQPHDGPCNGWPCPWVRKQMALDKAREQGFNGKLLRVGLDNWEVLSLDET